MQDDRQTGADPATPTGKISLHNVPDLLIFATTDYSMSGTSDLLREIADMLDAGFFKHITEEDLDKAKAVIMAFMGNVKVDYEQAKSITGKSDSAFNAKVSRSGIPVYKERLYRYSDMVKIKNKEV